MQMNSKANDKEGENGKSSKKFSYTGQRGGYVSIVSALLFMILVEGGVISLLIAIFISNVFIKMGLFSILGIFVFFMVGRMLAPLWTRHGVDAKYVRLRYGFDFKADIPRSAIIDVRAIREKVGVIPWVRYEVGKGWVVAAFSEKGQVLLRLDRAYPLRVGFFGRRGADQILINVDKRDEFLGVLDAQGVLDRSSGAQDGMPTSSEGKGIESEVVPEKKVSSVLMRGASTGVAVRTEGLTRRYGRVVAVDELNLRVHEGEIYGFLGANGAGKTTTMKMMVGLLEPDGGRVEIGGYDVWKDPLAAKAVLGYVGDRAMLYDRLTGREFLMFVAQMRGISRRQAVGDIDGLLDMLELSDRAESLCATYSYGMKRKLGLAAALLHHPAVLILDEPLNGLDPLSARRLKDLFVELADGGTAIFLSTHDLAMAESLCDRVGIIARGRLLVEGSADELREIAAAPDLESVFLALTGGQEEVMA